MPYTSLEELPEAVKKLPKELQKLWMEVWNGAYDRCMKKSKDKSHCEALAFAQAWSVVNENKGDRAMDEESRAGTEFQDLPIGDRYEPWDRDAADRRVRNWASSDHSGDKDKIDWARYRKAFFWYDAEQPENFGSYKLMFGDIKAGTLTAMPRGIFLCGAVMQGARGGADIPEADRPRVRAHIARYYDKMSKLFDDPDIIPPWERSASEGVERRMLRSCEIRVADDGAPSIRGYAAVFDRIADLGFFKEKIRKGAFARTIGNGDIRALLNHDPNFVLGRSRAGTLKLAEDDKGLAVEITPPDVQWARDLLVSMRRGDIDQMSFGFQTIKEDWDEQERLRTLVEVRLFDVSVVTFPAYTQTSAHVRSTLKSYGISFDLLADALVRARQGTLRTVDRNLLQSCVEILRAIVPANSESKPGPDSAEVHSGSIGGDPAEGHSRSWGRSLASINQRLHPLELELSLDN